MFAGMGIGQVGLRVVGELGHLVTPGRGEKDQLALRIQLQRLQRPAHQRTVLGTRGEHGHLDVADQLAQFVQVGIAWRVVLQ